LELQFEPAASFANGADWLLPLLQQSLHLARLLGRRAAVVAVDCGRRLARNALLVGARVIVGGALVVVAVAILESRVRVRLGCSSGRHTGFTCRSCGHGIGRRWRV